MENSLKRISLMLVCTTETKEFQEGFIFMQVCVRKIKWSFKETHINRCGDNIQSDQKRTFPNFFFAQIIANVTYCIKAVYEKQRREGNSFSVACLTLWLLDFIKFNESSQNGNTQFL